VSDHHPSLLTGRREVNHQPSRSQGIEKRLKGLQVDERLHAAGPRSELSLGLGATQEELDDDR
jgi:hypothetical protein